MPSSSVNSFGNNLLSLNQKKVSNQKQRRTKEKRRVIRLNIEHAVTTTFRKTYVFSRGHATLHLAVSVGR